MYKDKIPLLTLAGTLLVLATSAHGSELDTNDQLEEVTVIAERIRFGVSGPIEPEVQYDAASIRGLAVSSLEELLEEIAPDVSSGRGRSDGAPVVLLNGQRIASFREIRTYPPEAVERVEVYPEEVALKFGYRADQKVVNFVLRDRFKSLSTETEFAGSSDGAGESGELDLGFLTVSDGTRTSFHLEVNTQKPVHESDRSIINEVTSQPASFAGNIFGLQTNDELDPALSNLAGAPVFSASLPADLSTLTLQDLLASANNPQITSEEAYRTLVSDQQDATLSMSHARPLTELVWLTVSSEISVDESDSKQGLAELSYEIPATNTASPFTNTVLLNRFFPDVLERQRRTERAELNVTLAGKMGSWQWNWLNAGEFQTSKTETDRGIAADAFIAGVNAGTTNPFTLPNNYTLFGDVSESDTRNLRSRLLLNGEVWERPVGATSATINIAYRSEDQDSETVNLTGINKSDLHRETAEGSLSLEIPMIENDIWGDLSINSKIELNHLSDFGSLAIFDAGFTWSKSPGIRITGSFTQEEGAPSINNLGASIISTPNQRIFDFVTGQLSNATQITGGNPNLVADERTVFRLGLRLEPFDEHDLSFSAEFIQSEIDNPIVSFPGANAEIESAFPDRFVRDDQGALLVYDSRSINLDHEERQEIRWGIRYTKSLESKRPSKAVLAALAQRQQRPANANRPGRRFGNPGNRGGRLRLSLNHTWTLKDELTIAKGLAPIDYVGFYGTGRRNDGAEHRVTLRGSYSQRGFGSRVRITWLDSRDSLPQNGISEFYRASLIQVDTDFSYTFNRISPMVLRYPWLNNTRLKLGIDNLFNERPTVKDMNGLVPAGQSADELDPLGRVIEIEFRKLFR